MRQQQCYGLTVIEIVVVIAILATLAALVLPQSGKVSQTMEDEQLKNDFIMLDTDLKLYKQARAGYPRRLTDLSNYVGSATDQQLPAKYNSFYTLNPDGSYTLRARLKNGTIYLSPGSHP